MTEIIEFLLQHHSAHSHTKLAVRVLQCLTYIEKNIDTIAQHAGKDLLRDPVSHLAFHLYNYQTPAIAREQLLKLAAQARGVFREIMAIQDERLRHDTMSMFLNNINDTEVGCMEWRLRPAIMFYVMHSSSGVHDIHSLFREFCRMHPNEQLTDLLDFFALQVEYGTNVRDVDGNIKQLTWDIIKQYLRDSLQWEDVDELWQQGFDALKQPSVTPTRRGVFYNFTEEKHARHFLAYIKSMLPEWQQDLASIEVDYFPKTNAYCFWLPMEVISAFMYATDKKVAKDKEEEAASPQVHEVPQPEFIGFTLQDNLSREKMHAIRQTLRAKAKRFEVKSDFVIKSLRVDDKYFYRRFIEMVAPPYKKHELRRGHKGLFTVTGKRVYRRRETDDYGHDAARKQPVYTAEQKQGYSKNQSASFGMPTFHPLPFGFNHRAEKLVGVMIDCKHVLLSDRLYIYDGGTLNRPYDFDYYEDAEKYFKKKTKKTLFDHHAMQQFKQALQDNKKQHNEVLARLRWRADGSCMFFINDDSLPARLWAQEFARIMKNHLLAHGMMDESQSISICYYMPEKPALHMAEYTLAEQQLDALDAYQQYCDVHLRDYAYAENNFEILFSIPSDEIVKVFQEEFEGKNLVLHIMKQGYAHIIPSLLEQHPLQKQALLIILAEQLKQGQHQDMIWTILFNCFRAQLYELADFLIEHIPFKDNLCDVSAEQFIKAAKNGDAKFIALALEHSSICGKDGEVDTLHWAVEALTIAAEFGYTEVVTAIFDHRNSGILKNRISKNNKRPLVLAAQHGHAETLKVLLSKCGALVNDTDYLGMTPLIRAAESGNVDAVRVLLNYPDTKVNIESNVQSSALACALMNGHYETVKLLLAHPQIDVGRKVYGVTPLSLAITKKQTDIIKVLLKHSASVADLENYDLYERLKKISNQANLASDLKTFLLEKYLPAYIDRREQQPEYKHFYGRFFGQSKTVKIAAAKALLAGNDLKQHKKAFFSGELARAYELLNNCLATEAQENKTVIAPKFG